MVFLNKFTFYVTICQKSSGLLFLDSYAHQKFDGRIFLHV